MKLTKFALALLMAISELAVAAEYPCGIKSFEMINGLVATRFNSGRHWWINGSDQTTVASGKIRSQLFSGDKFYGLLEGDVLYVDPERPLALGIPHLSCIVTFRMDSQPRSVLIRESRGAPFPKVEAESIFYPFD